MSGIVVSHSERMIVRIKKFDILYFSRLSLPVEQLRERGGVVRRGPQVKPR